MGWCLSFTLVVGQGPCAKTAKQLEFLSSQPSLPAPAPHDPPGGQKVVLHLPLGSEVAMSPACTAGHWQRWLRSQALLQELQSEMMMFESILQGAATFLRRCKKGKMEGGRSEERELSSVTEPTRPEGTACVIKEGVRGSGPLHACACACMCTCVCTCMRV